MTISPTRKLHHILRRESRSGSALKIDEEEEKKKMRVGRTKKTQKP